MIGGVAAILLIVSVLFLPWYSLEHIPARSQGEDFICGTGNYSCTGFETFPIMRWFLLASALAPLILAYIIVTGAKLSWQPGEATMVVGFIVVVLIGYNGLLDKPGSGPSEIGVSLDYGYWVALLSAIVIAGVGLLRSEVGKTHERKAPGTV